MTEPVNTNIPEITDISVSIKVIRVNNRNMTYAVFKQITEEQFYDDKFEHKGSIWGRVNYFWGDDKDAPLSTVHLLWQKKGELRRTVFYKPKPFNLVEEYVFDLSDNFYKLGFPRPIMSVYSALKVQMFSLAGIETKHSMGYEQDSVRESRLKNNKILLEASQSLSLFNELKQLHQTYVELYNAQLKVVQLFIAVG